MSSGEIINIISAATTSIVVIIAALASLRTGAKVTDLKQVTQLNAQQVDGKLETIHQLTNSNLLAVKSDLVEANTKISRLQSMLVELMAEKERLIQKETEGEKC